MTTTKPAISPESISDDFTATVTEVTTDAASPAAGVRHFKVTWSAPTPIVPSPLKLTWQCPLIDIASRWTATAGANRFLPPDWADAAVRSMATQSAPVQCFYSLAGRNRLTMAVSDGLNVVELGGGVHEETATLRCWLRLFADVRPPIDRYEVTIRIDARDVPFSEALADVGQWWAGLPGYTPSTVPDVARRPMYSTWYGFHQQLDVGQVVEECVRAKELGCEAVIVDDGWQTNDDSRGYAFCGDWEPLRIPKMRDFVEKVHATGMKFLLWYAVPFIGRRAQALGRFEHKFLRFDERMGAGVLDPRFPDVRAYLIELYERHLREWDLDGFKLDFVDTFGPAAGAGGGRDIESVPAAADRLLSDVMTRLRAIKPNVMIEFRQSYIGPLMRKYGNLFRASDCPNDFIGNRVRVVDLRLLSGNSAVHSDMIMWHPDEPAESAALQLLQILFSVPQISVRLDRLPPAHRAMLRFWLGFWNRHRDLLLDAKFEPMLPGSLFPVVYAGNEKTGIVCLYDDVVGRVERAAPRLYVVNGTRQRRVIIETVDDAGPRCVKIRDCAGQPVATYDTHISSGVHVLPIPPAGVATLNAVNA